MTVPGFIRDRKSIRKYKDKQVSLKLLESLVASAALAPSAGNRQPWYFYVITNPAVKEELRGVVRTGAFLQEAPAAIVVCAVIGRVFERYGFRGAGLYFSQDTAAAIENMLLAAAANGLGTCWIGGFDEAGAAKLLGIDVGELWPVAIVTVGYPDEDPERRERLPLQEIMAVID